MAALIQPFRNFFPEIAPDAFVAANAVVVGRVRIGAEASIWYGVVLRGDVEAIDIGAGTNIQDGTIVHVTRDRFGCHVGAGVTVGHAAILHGCTLEDGCFVGMGATVMDGAVVETGAMVAAGALVTPGKRLRRGELWAGSPAKLLRPLSAEEIAGFATSAAHYVELAREYRVPQRP